MNVPTNCPNRRLNYDVTAEQSFFPTTSQFIECIFSNFPSVTFSGGAIYVSTTALSSISFDSCQFKNLSIRRDLRYGGAMYISEVVQVRMESTIFNNCSSQSDSGTIQINSASQCHLVHNCSIEDSFASSNSGGIYLWSYGITDSSFCSNHSSYGTVFVFRKNISENSSYIDSLARYVEIFSLEQCY
jgi:hypothetical protein